MTMEIISPNAEIEVLDIDPNDPVTIAESQLPIFDNPLKTRYLALRACGFSPNEAVQLIPSPMAEKGHLTPSAVRNWRVEDEEFRVTEANIAEYRDMLAKEHLNFQFTKNYSLILHKDFKVIEKSVNAPDSLSKNEQAYLIKARGHYTPQQLSILQQLIGEKPGKELSFTDLVLRMSRTTEELTLERKTG